MSKKEAFWSFLGWREFLAIFICIVVIVWVAAKLSPAFLGVISNSAWVQAIGSIFAIFASAGIVFWNQKLDLIRQRERDIQNLRVMLESIKTEVKATWEDFEASIGTLGVDAKEDASECVFVYAEQSFPVYQALVPRIAMIPSPDLRMQIVRTYSKLNSFVLRLGLHTELRKKVNQLRFHLAVARTAPSGASILEMTDILSSPDVTAVGISEYEAVSREWQRTHTELSKVGALIAKSAGEIRVDISELIDRIDGEVRTANQRAE